MVISHIQNWFLEPVKNIIKRQYKKHKKAPMHADIMHHPYQIFQMSPISYKTQLHMLHQGIIKLV